MPFSIRKLFKKSKKSSQAVPAIQLPDQETQTALPDRQKLKLKLKALSELENYIYEPLKGQRDIRLIILAPGSDNDDDNFDELSCSLVHASLDRPPSYEAISYVWGDPSMKREIRCGEARACVTLNLFSALRHLRYPYSPRTLWADAICINQADLQERGHQVQLMADIYSTSTTTLVWLGERSPDVDDAFDTTRCFRNFFPTALLHNLAPEMNAQSFFRYQLQKRNLGHTNNVFDLDLATFVRLLQRPWFKRKWVVQEVVKSKRVVLNIGRESMPWETLGDLATYVTAWSVDKSLAQLTFNHSAKDALKNIAMIENIRFGDISSLARLLRFTDRFACTDPRDQIIALLNLASDVNGAPELLPDYTVPAFEVFHRYAKWTALTKRSLDFLSYDVDPSWRKGMSVPSWVPRHNFNSSDRDKVALVPESKFSATKDCDPRISFSDNGDTLCVWGKLVDEVSALGERLSDRSEQVQWEPSETGPYDHDRTARANIAKVQEDFKKVLNFKRMAHDQPDGMSPARFEQFWRVLCWELTSKGDRAALGVGNYIAKMLEIMEASVAEFPQAEGDTTRIAAELAAWEPELVAGLDFTGGRLFCITAKDRLGCVPQAAQVGDRICVLYGGRLPFVIRPCGDGRYTYVGNCYLQGIMDGEAVDMKDLEEEEFMLV